MVTYVQSPVCFQVADWKVLISGGSEQRQLQKTSLDLRGSPGCSLVCAK
jgi:hypothetical protein